MYVQGIRGLFEFPGWVIERIKIDGDLTEVRLRRDARRRTWCPCCGGRAGENRRTRQMAWDLPMGSSLSVVLVYEAVQGKCRQCGYFTLRPGGIDDWARATWRLKRFVSRACRFMPLNRIRDLLPHVDQSTAKRWDKRVLEQTLGEPKLDGLRALLIDEKQVWSRHGYVTSVMNAESGELLYMGEGKKAETLEAFLEKLTESQKASIEAVGIDRMGSYKSVVERELPEAEIVFDKFHLIKNYHDVIDEVRRTEWRKAHAEDKQVIKGQRYNLFRNPENQTPKQKRDLRALLEMNEPLNEAYVLLDAFKGLWTYVYPQAARTYLDKWVGWAEETGVPAITRFARSVAKAKEQIVAYCRHPITMGKIESFNNTISRIVHRACGVRDLHYLFLKCRQEAQDRGEPVPISEIFD